MEIFDLPAGTVALLEKSLVVFNTVWVGACWRRGFISAHKDPMPHLSLNY